MFFNMSSVYANLILVRDTHCSITFHVAVTWIVLKLIGLNSDFSLIQQNLEIIQKMTFKLKLK